MNFNITDGRKSDQNRNIVLSKTADGEEIQTAEVSPKIWRLLRTNTSAIHLHILVLKSDLSKNGVQRGVQNEGQNEGQKSNPHRNLNPDRETEPDLESLIKEEDQCQSGNLCTSEDLPYDEITSTLIRAGTALYDVINMVRVRLGLG
jgi:hypothetical protein